MNNIIKNEINNELQIKNNLDNGKEQLNFLETTLGKAINSGIDFGIRTVLPDYIEEQVIDIKNNLLEYGLVDGIKKSIENSINIGKNVIGLVTGNFKDISQAQQAVKLGGVIENVSHLLNDIIDKLNKEGVINFTVAKTIKQGKNSILNSIEKNIDKVFDNQLETINYLDKHVSNWKEYFNNKDFNGMEKEIEAIEKQMKDLIPIESTINNVKVIKNIHNLIKNNEKNFNFTEAELQLAEKLI